MIEIGGGNAGCPWHGVYRHQTNVIDLPGANEIADIPFVSRPTITAYGNHAAGDVHQVAIPGQPAVTTTTAEAALGMTWLNYALLSGADHSLYGVKLGNRKWLYIDDAGAPWLARMEYSPVTDSGYINFTRFGQVSTADPLSPAQSISLSGLFSSSPATQWMIDDIKPGRGDGVAVVAYDNETVSFESKLVHRDARLVRACRALTITGTPPAASVTLGMHVPYYYGARSMASAGSVLGTRSSSVSGMWRVWNTPEGTPVYTDLPTNLVAGKPAILTYESITQYRDIVLGMYFKDGAPALATIDYDVTTTATGDGGALVLDGGEWKLNATRTEGSVFSATLRMGSQSVTVSGSGTRAAQIALDVDSIVSESGSWAGLTWPMLIWIDYVEQASAVIAQHLRLVTRRFSNVCYGLFDVSVAGALDSSRQIALVTPWSVDSAVYSTGQNAPWGRWATVHPVSHAVEADARALCFV